MSAPGTRTASQPAQAGCAACARKILPLALAATLFGAHPQIPASAQETGPQDETPQDPVPQDPDGALILRLPEEGQDDVQYDEPGAERPVEEVAREVSEILGLTPDALSDGAPDDATDAAAPEAEAASETQIQPESEIAADDIPPSQTLSDDPFLSESAPLETTETFDPALPRPLLGEEVVPPVPFSTLSPLGRDAGAFPQDLWRDSDPKRLRLLLQDVAVARETPALRRLLRRFLLSFPPLPPLDSQAPEPDDAFEIAGETGSGAAPQDEDDQIFLWRVRQLAALGMWPDLNRLLELLPRARLGFETPVAAELTLRRLRTLLLVGQFERACEEVRRELILLTSARADETGNPPAQNAHQNPWPDRAQVACRLHDGEDDIAVFGLDLLRETDVPEENESPEKTREREEFFALASARLGFGFAPEQVRFTPLNLFLVDGLEGADRLAAFAGDRELPSAALVALAYGEGLALPFRVELAENAAESGTLAVRDLAELYTRFQFPDDKSPAEQDPIAKALELSGAEQRAFLWQTAYRLLQQSGLLARPPGARQEQNPAPEPENVRAAARQVAELARLALESAREEGLEQATARLWRQPVQALAPLVQNGGDATALAEHAEILARLLLAADDGNAAAPWLQLLAQARDSQARFSLLRLWPEARLTGLKNDQIGNIDFQQWREQSLLQGRDPEQAAPIEFRLRQLLAALGTPTPRPDWFALHKAMLQEPDVASGREDGPAQDRAETSTKSLRDLALQENGFALQPEAAPALPAPARNALVRAAEDAALSARDGEALLLLLRLQRDSAARARARPDVAFNDALLIVRGLRRAGFPDAARERALELWRETETHDQ